MPEWLEYTLMFFAGGFVMFLFHIMWVIIRYTKRKLGDDE